ncbi:head-tail joining protein [Pseudomonas fulva]|uniref:head-tail joining protein n=1 Tax=Pseudomonas fulva TaxID=47880 RepID=UPI0032ECABA6
MAFRENVAFMDSALLGVLGDEAEIDGLAEPVPGFFSAPWLQPKLGQINTGLREPTFTVRIMHANGIKEGMHLVIKLAPEDGGGRYVIAARKPDGTGWINLTLREVR